MRFPVKRLLPLLLPMALFAAGKATAGETLESVLARAAAQQQVAVDYREVRHMQLLTEPWQASGRMFINADDFVMEQQKPERQLLVARRSLFWLYVPDKHFRRTGMANSSTAKNNFALFRPIMRGDRKALEQAFDIRFAVSGKQWQLELRPKQLDAMPYTQIRVSGKLGGAADRMRAEMADGDYTEWFFEQHAYSAATAALVKELTAEARGR